MEISSLGNKNLIAQWIADNKPAWAINGEVSPHVGAN